MKKRYYSPDFKEQTILQSYEVDNVKLFAEELGIRPSLLYTWRRASNSPLANPLQELQRLRKVLKAQKLQLDIIKQSQSQKLRTRKEVYRFIKEHCSIYPVEVMCKVLCVSSGSYYYWLDLGDKIIDKRKLDNQKYTPIIQAIFEKSNRTYGSPRIKAALEKMGYFVSRRRVYRIMLANNWKSKLAKPFRYVSARASSICNIPNLLKQNFKVERLNEVWVSDITYIPTQQGWIYLTTVMDLYDRQIIGWCLSKERSTITTTLVAWEKAIKTRTINQALIFHSDRGIEYTCNAFKHKLENNPFVSQSMSRSGNCWDNAVAESFFKTLKSELTNDYDFKSFEEAESLISKFIDVWYNQERLHSTLGYQTPREKELEFRSRCQRKEKIS